MSDQQPEMNQPSQTTLSGSGKIAIGIYALYFVGIFYVITPIVGIILAHMLSGNNPKWVESHYRFQIRTFWIVAFCAVVLTIVSRQAVLGIVTRNSELLEGREQAVIFFLMVFIWWIIRIFRGFAFASKGNPVPNPEGWLFGGR